LMALTDKKKRNLDTLAGAALSFGAAGLNRVGDQNTNKVFNPEAKPSNTDLYLAKQAGALGKAGDVKAPGITEFIYTIYSQRQESARDRLGEKIEKGDNLRDHVNHGLLDFNAANNQGVAATNVLANGGFSSDCSSAGLARDVASKAEKQSDSCEEFYQNIQKLSESLLDFFKSVVADSIIVSFSPLESLVKQRMQDLSANPETAKIVDDIKKNFKDLNSSTILAAVLIGWFLRNSLSVADENRLKSDLKWIRDKSPSGMGSYRNLEKTTADFVKVAGESLRRGDVKFKSKDFSGQTELVLQLAAKQAEKYTWQIKEVVAQTLDAIFRVQPKPQQIDEIIALQITCTNIVAECYRRAAARQDIEIDEKYIKELEKLKFLKTYSKTLGFVSNKEKIEKTRKVENNIVTWTLRYPLGVGKVFQATASVKEAAMVYAFAVIVTQYVDILRLSVGLDDWDRVRQNLNNAIGVINRAANEGLYG